MNNKIKLYSLENIEAISGAFDNLQPKSNSLTAREIVEKLLPQINSALSMRYSFKEITETILNINGCNISTNALKVAYEEVSETKKTKRIRKARVTKTKLHDMENA